MDESPADLISLILALDVPEVVAIAVIYVEPEPNGYLATFSYFRPGSALPADSDGDRHRSEFKGGRIPVAVFRLGGRDEARRHIQALHDSGLLGQLAVVRSGSARGSDRTGSAEYVVRTHAGSFGERAEWLRELTRDLNMRRCSTPQSEAPDGRE